ncbi:hypothetical protein IWX91DRAFT_199034 [Phyllosticta citricarpa]
MMTKAMTNFCIFPLNCSSAYLEKVRVEPMSCVFCFEAGQTHPVLAELCKGSVTPRVLACRHLPHLVLLPCCFWDFHSVSGPSWTFTFSCFSRLSTSTSADTLLRLALPFSFFLLLLFSLFFFFFFFFFCVLIHDEEMFSRWTPYSRDERAGRPRERWTRSGGAFEWWERMVGGLFTLHVQAGRQAGVPNLVKPNASLQLLFCRVCLLSTLATLKILCCPGSPCALLFLYLAVDRP